ncbi:unnamed protein product (macronuclear) [Paramecium tetraurelia]|uniref:Kinesin motor domain-containing protein n=1 Tax=Paramecium tetraurelia TaxID=5888 RepID=A0C8U6_PARTE|nr:uncharacterized protein GSPATT00036348001 [Paramecium tetraurelia]CAK67213.1 unnamed protein product [Paramecium tetraurelia]|eukprot:XP_001434610.1 hypothetical protein (macronuclear) [Paramecium tetraurelia strain d4-2]
MSNKVPQNGIQVVARYSRNTDETEVKRISLNDEINKYEEFSYQFDYYQENLNQNDHEVPEQYQQQIFDPQTKI